MGRSRSGHVVGDGCRRHGGKRDAAGARRGPHTSGATRSRTGAHRRASVFCRSGDRRSRRSARGLTCHAEAPMGARTRVAVSRADRPTTERTGRMTSSHWIRVRELFEQALDCEPDRVAELLNQPTIAPEVRAEVASLIAHHGRAATFLTEPLGTRAPDLFVEESPVEAGAAIGPYKIVRELG